MRHLRNWLNEVLAGLHYGAGGNAEDWREE